MRLTLVRHATLVLDFGGLRLVVDPMLDDAAAQPPVPGTPNERRNPLVPLPVDPVTLVDGLDAVLVTHLHADHFDDGASRFLPRRLPLFCQPEDVETLGGRGFADVRAVEAEVSWRGLALARTGGRHGHGGLAERLAPVSGFVLRGPGEPILYVAGDTVWCDDVERALAEHVPDVVVVNAGGARFLEGDPITMTSADVLAVRAAAPGATIVAVHLEAINHCLETRADLRQATEGAGIVIPDDGATVDL